MIGSPGPFSKLLLNENAWKKPFLPNYTALLFPLEFMTSVNDGLHIWINVM
jgi:hypothetical protein